MDHVERCFHNDHEDDVEDECKANGGHKREFGEVSLVSEREITHHHHPNDHHPQPVITQTSLSYLVDGMSHYLTNQYEVGQNATENVAKHNHIKEQSEFVA